MRKLVLVLLSMVSWGQGWSQQVSLSNLRDTVLVLHAQEQPLDSMFILPATVEVYAVEGNHQLDTSFYGIKGKSIFWKKPYEDISQQVRVRYRVMPYQLDQKTVGIPADSARMGSGGRVIGYTYNPFEDSGDMIDFKGLDYNGSFARGISFGNSQSLVLNSSFNLQLSGKLNNDVEILAAITDENIPLQPEGNTQQLRDFDKIFIQLSKENNRLIAGDYELRRPQSYFMNYFKKLQGATFSSSTELPAGKFDASGSVAISRGKFSRNNLATQEGNQGPYKLRGNEGERFIIVLAGTEKVWMDGERLERGIERDYIIDYNRGEITFTNQRLITKDSRIIVEFEYSDQNFTRTLYAVNTSYSAKKFRLNFNVFNEQDGRNSGGVNELTDTQKRILTMAGDNPLNAIAPSLDTLEEFTAFRVAYELVDSLTDCGTVDSILLFSTDPKAAKYTARFSLVGPGNGNYVLDPEPVANERVYRWVAPDPTTCTPRGNYAPVVQLIAPKQNRLITLGGTYDFDEHTEMTAEVAINRNDRNRFSREDRQDDQGIAAFTSFAKHIPLTKQPDGWAINTAVKYEVTSENFQALNPYRAPEFLRDWNLTDVQGIGSTEKATEHVGTGTFSLEKTGLANLTYGFSQFFRDTFYRGLRHTIDLAATPPTWEIQLTGDFLSTSTPERTTQFDRPNFSIAKTFERLGSWRLGVAGEREKSSRFATEVDTLLPSSFYFDRYKFFLESPAGKSYQFNVNFSRRADFRPAGKSFERSFQATDLNINGSWRQKRTLQWRGNFTYRQLKVQSPDITFDDEGTTLLGRTDILLTLAKGSIRANTTYEIGSGQEPRLEFSYLRVPQGEGTHIWLDSLFNNDGIIQPNEMEVAPFRDKADYIRVTTFTDEFIRTNNTSLNQALFLNPKAVWFSAGGIRKVLSKFSSQSTLLVNRKANTSADVSLWNPLQLSIVDTALVSISSSIRNTLFFNRGNAVFDFQVGQAENKNRVAQTSGFETRQRSEYFLKSRLNLSQLLSARFDISTGFRISDSEFFDNKDYNIDFLSIDPQLTYQPSQQLRFTFRFKYQADRNQLPETGERSIQRDLNLETAFNRSSKTSLKARLSYIQVKFNGNVNSPVGFAMLNGLQKGRNLLWNLTLDRQLARNIRLNLSYDGRKTGMNRVVHVGRAQVAAVF